MSASFSSLRNAYLTYNRLDTVGLYTALGWKDLADKPEWPNTCAVRSHIDLLYARSEWNCLRQCYFNSGEIRFWAVA